MVSKHSFVSQGVNSQSNQTTSIQKNQITLISFISRFTIHKLRPAPNPHSNTLSLIKTIISTRKQHLSLRRHLNSDLHPILSNFNTKNNNQQMSGARLCSLLGELGFEGHTSLDPDSFEWPFQYEDARPILDWLCSSLRPSNVLSPSELSQLYPHLSL